MDNVNETTNTNETAENTAAGTSEQVEKTYTQKEVLELLQREGDKRVTQALKTERKKYEKQLSLAQLDGDERAKAEKDARIAELEEMIAQMNITNNKSELKSVLGARGLSAEFADIIEITDDLEESQAKIDKLDKLFKAAVKAEVEKRLAGNAPRGNGSSASAEITKETAKKMSIAELDKFSRENPELFNKIFS